MVGQMSEVFNLKIASSLASYSVDIYPFIDPYDIDKNRITVIDKAVLYHPTHRLTDEDKLIPIEGSEDSKQFSFVGKVLEVFADLQLKRGEIINVVGGGSVQDVATVASSLYMRGIEWKYFPTTLASMMDSCIGGKSSINLGNYKNLIGNFHPPKEISIYPSYVQTLPKLEISAGISEGVKICFAKGKLEVNEFIDAIEVWRNDEDQEMLRKAIFLALESKKYFIEIDEFDQGERQNLNFGHSFGHALEAATGYSVPHGIAVLIGMLSAIHYAEKSFANTRFIEFLQREFDLSDFSTVRVRIDEQELSKALSRDKKNSSTHQVLILPNTEGKLERVSIPISSTALKKGVDCTLNAFSMLGGNFEVF
jgi:3-dehydroquinate synthase